MSFLNTGCGVIPDHIEQACNNFKKGGMPAFALVSPESALVGDWSNSALWLTEIAANRAKVVNKVKFQIPAPSPVKSDNPVACGSQQILDGFDWTFTGIDANRNTFNDDFYTNLNSQSVYVVFLVCDEDEIVVIDKKVTFVAFPIYPESNRERQQYNVTGEWSSKPNWMPKSYTAPTGVFSL